MLKRISYSQWTWSPGRIPTHVRRCCEYGFFKFRLKYSLVSLPSQTSPPWRFKPAQMPQIINQRLPESRVWLTLTATPVRALLVYLKMFQGKTSKQKIRPAPGCQRSFLSEIRSLKHELFCFVFYLKTWPRITNLFLQHRNSLQESQCAQPSTLSQRWIGFNRAHWVWPMLLEARDCSRRCSWDLKIVTHTLNPTLHVKAVHSQKKQRVPPNLRGSPELLKQPNHAGLWNGSFERLI